MTDTDTDETVLVMNPHSGTADHAKAVHDRAELRGYTLLETAYEDHAIELAKETAERGAEMVVAVGGDGTVNEVVTGVHEADALDSVTVGVVPTGTGNDFATNIGITGIDEAFTVLKEGERRRLDLGFADGQPFVNSCIAGIVAEASDETSAELKSRIGGLAYVLTTARVATEFSGLELSASVVEGSTRETVWEGAATVVLVGNGRRFSLSGSEQADLEDGLLDVTIIEDAGSLDLVGDRLEERLFDREGDNLERILASSLELSVEEAGSASFSLDGEIADFDSVTLTADRGGMKIPVGEGYEPHPDIE